MLICEHVPSWLKRVLFFFQDETKNIRKDCRKNGLCQKSWITNTKRTRATVAKTCSFFAVVKFLGYQTKWYVIVDHVPLWPKRGYFFKEIVLTRITYHRGTNVIKSCVCKNNCNNNYT